MRIGRSRSSHACAIARSSEYPRSRSSLTYATRITPVCTETPKSARKPTPDETEKFVLVSKQREQATEGRRDEHVHEDEQRVA